MAARCWLPAGKGAARSFLFLTNASSSKPQQTLRKPERLSGRKAIDELFRTGISLVEPPLRLTWLTQGSSRRRSQALFSVPKSNFRRAVDRNLLKRRMRAAYQLEKVSFLAKLEQQAVRLGFVYVGKEKEEFSQIHSAMTKLLDRVGVKGDTRN